MRLWSSTIAPPGYAAFRILGVLWLLAGLSALYPLSGQQGDGRGKRSPLLRPCDEHYDQGRRDEARTCYYDLVRGALEPAVRAEAYWKLDNFQQANERFRAALSADPENADLRVRWGYLFLQTENKLEAAKLFEEALGLEEDHPAATLARAELLSRNFEGESREIAQKLTEDHPDLFEAYLLLARISLEEEDPAQADEFLDQALEKIREQSAAPLEAYALKAAADLLRGNTESEWIAKALEYNPMYGRIYAELAHFYVMTRRYREAEEFYRQAVEMDPDLWDVHADLGVNYLRLGKDEEAQHHLEIAYQGDPYSATTVNTLRLLDSFKHFQTHTTDPDILTATPEELEAAAVGPQALLKLHEDEADLLRPYLTELTLRCLRTFEERYQFKLQEPVRIELYPDHDDFAVRTVGLPGLGLLGVTFGYVVAMDSPSARPGGSFHWGTTLWHELAHVFSLEMTDHLVPRWFSEGISMYEEWEAHPAWGERASPDFLSAMNEDKLLPIADLDKGFVRPSYPNQIAVSYMQAGLVCQLIVRDWGFEKIPELLDGYKAGKSTPQNIEDVLAVSTEELDEQFDEYLQERYGEASASLAEWRELLKTALRAARDKTWEDVIEPAARARDLNPDFVESGNPYRILAEAYKSLNDDQAAASELLAYRDRGGKDPATLKELAGLLEDAGLVSEAIRTLESLLYVTPGDPELHQKLGDWLLETDRFGEAEREFQAVLALNPLDIAGAHFNLARTYYEMEDSKKTRRHLLMSLEAAPSYRPAQRLLLETISQRETSE